MPWSKKYNQCRLCTTNEWKHQAKGYCVKCRPIELSIEKVQNWNAKNQTSLVPIPGFTIDHINLSIRHDNLEKVKVEIIRQLKNRLFIFEMYSDSTRIDAIALERLMNEIAVLILKEKGNSIFHGHSAIYEQALSQEQTAIIYKDLISILVQRRFSLNLNKILLNPN